jgi:hypothetical protein
LDDDDYNVVVDDRHGQDGPPPFRLARPPAATMISVLNRILTATAFQSMIAPYIAQEQHEYYEVLLRKNYRAARWIEIRMHLLIGYNVACALASMVTGLLKRAR